MRCLSSMARPKGKYNLKHRLINLKDSQCDRLDSDYPGKASELIRDLLDIHFKSVDSQKL